VSPNIIFNVLQCVAQCAAVRCSALQCVAVLSVLQCTAVCCSVLQCVGTLHSAHLFLSLHIIFNLEVILGDFEKGVSVIGRQ